MKITTTVGRTYNTGNYESIRLDVTFQDDVQENEKPNQARARLFTMALDALNDEAFYLSLKKTGPN